jgi:SecD/SecF fusion protein
MTSLTTLVVMVPLLVMVSSAISEFIVPLMVGVIVGCYSSIFICSPMYYDLNKKDEMSKYMLKQQEKVKTEKKTFRAVRKEKKNK